MYMYNLHINSIYDQICLFKKKNNTHNFSYKSTCRYTYNFKHIQGLFIVFKCSVDHSSIVIVEKEIFGLIMTTLKCNSIYSY